MTRLVTPEEAERAAFTPIPPEDVLYLKRLYNQERFVNELRLGDVGDLARGRKIESVTARVKKMQSSPYWQEITLPALQKRFPDPDSLDKWLATLVEEHRSADAELFGDFITKLKKWVLYVVPEHANRLKFVPFAAFRLDTLNALSILMPSGRPAVILNTAFLDLASIVSILFSALYVEYGSAPKGLFGGGPSQESAALLEVAQCYASNFRIQSGIKRNIRRFNSNPVWAHMCLFALLHECGHILRGHLELAKTNSVQSAREESLKTWEFTRALELDSDKFAAKALLYFDKKPIEEHAIRVTASIANLLGFIDLVERYRNENSSATHPLATERWRNLRKMLIRATNTDRYVKRFEFIVASLNTERELRMQGFS